MLKRRMDAELTQVRVAELLGVGEKTYNLWEQDKAQPLTRYYPAIFAFLGYDPFPPSETVAGQLGVKRRSLGLTQEDAARLLGVDESTFARWENGTWRPRLSGDRITRFLDAQTPDDLVRDQLPKRRRKAMAGSYPTNQPAADFGADDPSDPGGEGAVSQLSGAVGRS